MLLAVGTRFQAYNTMNWKMQLPPTILHVNIEADEFNKNYPATVALHGDAKAVLTDLTALLDGRSGTEPGWAERGAADETGRHCPATGQHRTAHGDSGRGAAGLGT